MTAGDAANGVKPMGVVDYGQFDAPHTGHDWHRSSTTTNPMAARLLTPVLDGLSEWSRSHHLAIIGVSREWIEGAQAILDRGGKRVGEDREELVQAIGEYVLTQYEEAKGGNA